MTAHSARRRRLAVAALSAAALLLLGCAASGDVAVTSGEGSALAGRPVAGQSVTLPLDAYTFSHDEARVLGEAAEVKVKECFAQHGFAPSEAEPLPVGADEPTPARHERRYAVADLDIASKHGYQAPDVRDVRQEFYAAHTADELAVLVGADANGQPLTSRRGRAIPAGGCLGQAMVELAATDAGTQLAGEDLVSAIQAEAWHAALRDPRVLDVFAAWSACMAEAGYDYDAPMAANDDPAWQRKPRTQAEIAVATTDVMCKQQTGVVAVWSSAEAEHQAVLIERHRGELNAYRAVLDAQVAGAKAVLG